MIFYHGTSKQNWELIKKEGFLFGIRNAPSRCTYLAVDIEEAKRYGEVLLKVNYIPSYNNDNYCEDCWQVRVYTPISIKDIELIEE